jgi:hypothetical protein
MIKPIFTVPSAYAGAAASSVAAASLQAGDLLVHNYPPVRIDPSLGASADAVRERQF